MMYYYTNAAYMGNIIGKYRTESQQCIKALWDSRQVRTQRINGFIEKCLQYGGYNKWWVITHHESSSERNRSFIKWEQDKGTKLFQRHGSDKRFPRWRTKWKVVLTHWQVMKLPKILGFWSLVEPGSGHLRPLRPHKIGQKVPPRCPAGTDDKSVTRDRWSRSYKRLELVYIPSRTKKHVRVDNPRGRGKGPRRRRD